MALIATMLFIAGTYVFARYRSKAVLVGVSVAVASLYIVLTLHPPLRWLPGGPVVWRTAYSVVLAAFLAFLWLYRGRANLELKRWRWGMFVAGLAAFFAFCLGGFVREACKNPHTVYGQIVKPEVLPQEADRFLLYEKCLKCHHRTPQDIPRPPNGDWAAAVETMRLIQGVKLTDEEAKRIVRHLREGRG